MKILLLEHPRKIAGERCNDIANTPLSSSLITGYTAGMLAGREHEVKIVEGYLDKLSYDQIAGIIDNFEPDILGIHLIYSWGNEGELFSFLKEIKRGGIKWILAYGFYPTFAYSEILRQCPEIDAVIGGEPEHTFVQVAEAVQNRIGLNSPIPGLVRQADYSRSILQRREPEANLDLLPDPIRTDALLRMPQINIEGSRGCYGGCTFCYINPYYGKPACWRGRSPEKIIAEIDSLLERHGKRSFYFVDPNFFGPGRSGSERVRRLASLLRERKIIFGLEGRVNDIREETIAALVEAGLQELLIGLESGKNEALKRLNKMTTVEQNEEAVRILRKYGLEPNIGFIMFEPDSSLEDIRTNFEFLLRNDLLANLPVTANVLYHPQIILQGTKAYHDFQDQGRLKLLSTTYEGTVAFANRQVAALAQLMSIITNHLFREMAGIWSGRVEKPEGAEAVYRKVNQTLIRTFSDVLTYLESDKKLVIEETEALANMVTEEINLLLAGEKS